MDIDTNKCLLYDVVNKGGNLMNDFILMFKNKSAVAVILFFVVFTYVNTVQINPVKNDFAKLDEESIVLNK